MSSHNPLHESPPQTPSHQQSKETQTHLEKPHDEAEPATADAAAVKDEEEEGGAPPPEREAAAEKEGGRERLKRHPVEMSGRVWIPDMWGQEEFLKDWIDCAAFDASLVGSSIMMARDSLAQQGRRAGSTRLRIQN